MRFEFIKNNIFIYGIVSIIGIVLTVLSGYALINAKIEQRKIRFTFDSTRIVQALEEDIKKDLRVLTLVSNDIRLKPDFERHDFKTFTENHLPYNKSIQAIEWIPKVNHDERIQLEESGIKDGFPGFQFTEIDSNGNLTRIQKTDFYFPVYYVEPYVGNELALGFDLGSDLKRYEALIQSANRGSHIATPPISLVQGGKGILVFNPLYYKTKPGYEPPSFDRLKGFVLIVYNINRLVTYAVEPYLVKGLHITLTDTEGSSESSLFDEFRMPLKYNEPDFQYESDLIFSGRNWKFTVYADEQYESNKSLLDVYLIVILEISFVLIVLLFFRYLSAENKRVRFKVEERTRELSELNETLQEKNKDLEHFTFIVSHDLQEPLRTIINFSNLLMKQNVTQLDDKSEKFIGYITNATTRMKNMIHGILNLSLIGKTREIVTVCCNTLVHDVLDDLRLIIKETNSVITYNDLPTLNGYEVELRQLFQNLIMNAIKFRKQDIQPKVKISAQQVQNHWTFSINDNGIGIDEKHKERIFQIFQRLHTREEYEGTGIGLANCKKIIELHSGKIWIESQPGIGSTFYFTIPIKEMKDE